MELNLGSDWFSADAGSEPDSETHPVNAIGAVRPQQDAAAPELWSAVAPREDGLGGRGFTTADWYLTGNHRSLRTAASIASCESAEPGTRTIIGRIARWLSASR